MVKKTLTAEQINNKSRINIHLKETRAESLILQNVYEISWLLQVMEFFLQC